MANFKKSFNFRNGVQVDNDNFVVNSNGLVGIGTSVPTEALDVIGNVDIDGLLSTPLATIGLSTITQLVADNVNVGGAITATTFYGSALGLTDIYAIAVDGWHITGGHISTTSSVSVGRDTPDNANAQFTVDSDVSIGSTVRLRDNHIILNSFNGAENTSDITNDPKGSGLGFDVRFDNNGTSVLGALINSNYSIDKCDLHFNVRENFSSNFPNSPALSITTEQNVGVKTDNPTSALYVYGDGYYTGVVTATSYYANSIFASTLFGNLIGIANTALDVDSNSSIVINQLSVTGPTTVTTISVENSAVFDANATIAIGLTTPESDIHVYNTADASIQVTAPNTVATVTVGRNIDPTISSGQLRFGNTDGGFPSSTEDSLDLINYDDGNINFYLNPGGSGTGVFNWFSPGLSNIMTLNQDGYLGLNDNNPEVLLSVGGNVNVTGIATIQNLNIGNDLNVSSDIIANKLGVRTDTAPAFHDLQIGGDPSVSGGGVSIDADGVISARGSISGGGIIRSTGVAVGGGGLVITGPSQLNGTLTANNTTINGSLSATSIDSSSYGVINTTALNISGNGGVYAPTGVGTFNSLDVVDYGVVNPTELILQSPGQMVASGIVTASAFYTSGYKLENTGISNGTYPLAFEWSDEYDGGLLLNFDGPQTSPFEGIQFDVSGTDLIITVVGVGSAIIALS